MPDHSDSPTAGAPDSLGASWAETTERGVRLGLTISLVLGLLSTISLMPQFFPRPDAVASLGLGLVASGVALIGVVLWRNWHRPWQAPVVLLAVGVGQALAVSHMTVVPALSDTWWPRPILLGVVGYLALSHRFGWLFACALVTANHIMRMLSWQPNPTLPALTSIQAVGVETGQLAAVVGLALVIGFATRSAARQADQSTLESRSTSDSVERSEQAHRDADRFVHDEVLHTLRTVALDRVAIPARNAVDAVASLRRILEIQQDAPANRGFLEELRPLGDGLGIPVRWAGPTGLSLPRDVATALSGAVRECIRNAARHSGSRHVEVTVRHTGFALSIVVADEGRGFDPTMMGSGLGLRESVLARTTDIGGTARVVSAPGRGTRVYLRWSPIPDASYEPHQLGGGAIPELFPSVTTLLVPLLLQGLWAGVLLYEHARRPMLSLIITLLVVLAACAAMLIGLRSGLRAWHSLLLSAIALGATALSIALVPTPGAHPRMLWLAVLASSIPSVQSIFRPLREAVVVGLACEAVLIGGLALTLPRGTPWSPFVSVLTAPLISVSIAIAIRVLVDRCAFDIWTAEEQRRDAAESQTATASFTHRLDQRLLGSRSHLITFLDAILAEPSRVEDAVVRAQADELEKELRESLALAEPALAAQLTRLRVGGWTLRTAWADGLPVSLQATVASALGRLPSSPPPNRRPRVTVTAAPGSGGWRASLLVRGVPDAWVQRITLPAPWGVQSDDGLYATLVVGAEGDRTSGDPLPSGSA